MADEGKFKGVQAPTLLDGSPVDKEEASRVHQALVAGELEVKASPEVMAEMAAAGITLEDFKRMLIEATKKTMN